MNKFKLLRMQNDYTQATLSEALGISQQSVSQWECGKAEPRLATIAEIAKLFGCDYMDIVMCFVDVEK